MATVELFFLRLVLRRRSSYTAGCFDNEIPTAIVGINIKGGNMGLIGRDRRRTLVESSRDISAIFGPLRLAISIDFTRFLSMRSSLHLLHYR